MNDYVVFDIETTGLNHELDEIIEIGALKIKQGKVIDTFNKLIKPEKSIPIFITELTGISNEMVEDANGIKIVLTEFINFISDSKLVGHNIDNFDIKFITEKCIKNSINVKSAFITIDTLKLAQMSINKNKIENYKLKTLCDFFRINIENQHRAYSDVYATFILFETYLKKYISKYFDNYIRINNKTIKCPSCGKGLLIKKYGKYGVFTGCSEFPKCRYANDYIE